MKSKPTAVNFCKAQLAMMKTVLPGAALQRVLDCNGDWAGVKEQLHELCNSGDTGLDMWSFALIQILADDVKQAVVEHVAKWVKKGELTEAGLGKSKLACLQAVSDMDNYELMPQKRQIQLSCGGHDFVFEVESTVQMISVAHSFAWRPMAVQQAKLRAMWCEEVVLPNCVVASDRPVDVSLVRQPDEARRQMNSVFKEQGDITGEVAAGFMKKTEHHFTEVDQEFFADLVLVQEVSGANSQARLMRRICSLLPTADREVGADLALAELCRLTQDNVYKMASKPAKVQHGVIKAVLCSIVDKRAPDMTTALGERSMKAVTDRFKFFARHTSAASADASGVTVTGVEAIEKWYVHNAEKKKKKSGSPLVKKDIVGMATFLLLVEDGPAKTKYVKMIDEVSSGSGVSLRKTPTKGKAGIKDKAAAEAAAMFT